MGSGVLSLNILFRSSRVDGSLRKLPFHPFDSVALPIPRRSTVGLRLPGLYSLVLRTGIKGAERSPTPHSRHSIFPVREDDKERPVPALRPTSHFPSPTSSLFSRSSVIQTLKNFTPEAPGREWAGLGETSGPTLPGSGFQTTRRRDTRLGTPEVSDVTQGSGVPTRTTRTGSSADGSSQVAVPVSRSRPPRPDGLRVSPTTTVALQKTPRTVGILTFGDYFSFDGGGSPSETRVSTACPSPRRGPPRRPRRLPKKRPCHVVRRSLF